MGDKDYRYKARKISKLIEALPDWEKAGASRHAANLYGVQKAFRRVTKRDAEEDL